MQILRLDLLNVQILLPLSDSFIFPPYYLCGQLSLWLLGFMTLLQVLILRYCCKAPILYYLFIIPLYLYPQTKVGDILDSGPSRRRRRRRNFLVDAITQKQINIFFSNLVHMLRVPKGRSLF